MIFVLTKFQHSVCYHLSPCLIFWMLSSTFHHSSLAGVVLLSIIFGPPCGRECWSMLVEYPNYGSYSYGGSQTMALCSESNWSNCLVGVSWLFLHTPSVGDQNHFSLVAFASGFSKEIWQTVIPTFDLDLIFVLYKLLIYLILPTILPMKLRTLQ